MHPTSIPSAHAEPQAPLSGCWLTESDRDGDRCLLLGNQQIDLAVNVSHGAHLYRLAHRRSGINVLYADPRGPRHYRIGGWYELFPNAGGACNYGGYTLSRAGDIQHRVWRHRGRFADAGRVEIELTAESADMPFRLDKRIIVTESVPGVRIEETVTNLGDRPLPYLWGQHITFGAPFLAPGTRVSAPDVGWFADPDVDTAGAPYARGARGPLHALPRPDGGTMDLATFPSSPFTAMLFSDQVPADAGYSVTSPSTQLRADVTWDAATFPRLWLWATNGGMPRDPAVVAMAVEPQACEVPGLSNAASLGRAPVLGPGESRSAWVRALLRPATA